MKGDGLGAGIRRSASDQRLAKADIACRSSRANAGFLIATPGSEPSQIRHLRHHLADGRFGFSTACDA